MEEAEHVRQMVCIRIGEVEDQVKCLEALRKSLLRKAYEAKQSILSTFVSERESMYTKEMSILSEVDNLHHSKDDALVTQLNKLNQVLGCLRNCLESIHPCEDCLEKFDDIDMLSVEEVDVEFTSAYELLKNAVQPNKASTTSAAVPAADLKGNMTKWLLTPTNNHSNNGSRKAGEEDFMSTEWLLRYHAQTKPGLETGSHFLNVKSGKKDDWLTEGTGNTSSLYIYALTNFDSIINQAPEIWLQKAQFDNERERRLSESVATSSVCTSSLSSSCVIIPSGATSESSAIGAGSSVSSESSSKASVYSESAWPNDDPPARSHSPYEVNQWVAKCESSEEWLVRDRPRLMSMASSDIRPAFEKPVVEDEWLVQANLPDRHTRQPYGCDEWLTNAVPYRDSVKPVVIFDADWLHQAKVASKSLHHWLPVISSKMEALCAEYADEKMDLSFEKNTGHDWLATVNESSVSTEGWNIKCSAAVVNDNWLAVNFDDSKENDWLNEEEKSDRSTKTSGVAARHDREWLVVIDQMSQIATSELSGWLRTQQNKTSLSCQNNTAAQPVNWLR